MDKKWIFPAATLSAALLLAFTSIAKEMPDPESVSPIALFWGHPGVSGITNWRYLPGLWRSEERAFLVDENGAERPGMLWLKHYVQNAAPGLQQQTE